MCEIVPREVKVHLLMSQVVDSYLDPRLHFGPEVLGSQERLMREAPLEQREDVRRDML